MATYLPAQQRRRQLHRGVGSPAETIRTEIILDDGSTIQLDDGSTVILEE